MEDQKSYDDGEPQYGGSFTRIYRPQERLHAVDHVRANRCHIANWAPKT